MWKKSAVLCSALTNFLVLKYYIPRKVENISSTAFMRLDSQSKGPDFKVTGWRQVQLSLSFFQGWSNEYQKFLGACGENVSCLSVVSLWPWGTWIPSIKRDHEVWSFIIKMELNFKWIKLPPVVYSVCQLYYYHLVWTGRFASALLPDFFRAVS